MTNKDIFKAVGCISDGLIDEAAAPKKPRRGVMAGLAALAACAAIALIAWQPWDSPAAPIATAPASASPPPPAETEINGVMVPAPPWEPVYVEPEPMPEAPEDGMAADMIGFFIYNGRMYTQTMQYVGASLLGEYIFSPAGGIDEWSGAEEYVEGASNVAGEVRAVRGYDTNFRLALVTDTGAELYDCPGDMWRYWGADLFKTCLHIENAVAAYSVADADWEQGRESRRYIDLEALEPFVATLMTAPMQDWGRGSENGDIYDYDYAEAHLYLELADGTTVPLRLFENGCVKYDGSAARICAWMPGAIFDEVFDMCR